MFSIKMHFLAAVGCLGWFMCAPGVAHADCAGTQAEREVLRSFRFESATGDYCATGSLERKAVDSLLFIKNLRWTQTRDENVQGLIDADPFTFLRTRIDKIVFDQPGADTLCDNGRTLAFNLIGERELHICSNAKAYSTFYLAEVLIHEARHSDGDGYRHYDCQTGVRDSGKKDCDESYSAGGAYAVSAEFAIRVSRDPMVSREIRNEARAEVFNHFLTRFYNKPPDMKLGVFLQDGQGRIHFFDGTSVTSTPLDTKGREHILAIRNHRLLVFDPKSQLAADLNYSGQMFVAGDGLAKFYRETLTAEERARVVDFHYGSNFSCVLLTNALRCLDDKGNEIKNLKLASIRARGFMDVTQSSNYQEGGLNLVDDSGTYYPLPASISGMRNLRESDLRGASSNLINLAFVGPKQVALDRNGDLGLYSPREQTWTSPAPGRKFVKLLGTVYWSKRFESF